MNTAYREQHPLLCDDLFEDDHYSPQQQRFRSIITYRGRAKHSLRGAAAVFTRWPDHWTSFLTYWWIALGMIAITTLLVYNSLFAFAILPHDSVNPSKPVANTEYKLPEITHLPEVYMHVVKNYNDDIDIHQYLPYIEILSNKFNRFKYHLIIVMNDTSIRGDDLNAETNNENALNSLWDKEKAVKQKPLVNSLIRIEYVVLSEYMDNSPLKKYWRSLSYQLIEFLIRAISIWDKGGIAFNPVIITPMSPRANYAEKLQNILRDYKKTNKKLSKDVKSKKKYTKKNSKKVKQKVNNIRDVINALNNNDYIASNYAQQTLAEAEDTETLRMKHSGDTLFSVTEKYAANKSTTSQSPYDTQIPFKLAPHLNKNDIKHLERKRKSIRDISNNSTEIDQAQNSTSKMSLLPLFLEFLFHNKPGQTQKVQESNGNNFTKLDKITENKDIETSNGNTSYSITDPLKDVQQTTDKYAPMIIFTKYVQDEIENSSSLNTPSKFENANQLTIDLKGNIIATEIPCHAFIGTVFSNAVHHESVTITDFIIAELSIFCNGLLSSCEGIDLILL